MIALRGNSARTLGVVARRGNSARTLGVVARRGNLARLLGVVALHGNLTWSLGAMAVRCLSRKMCRVFCPACAFARGTFSVLIDKTPRICYNIKCNFLPSATPSPRSRFFSRFRSPDRFVQKIFPAHRGERGLFYAERKRCGRSVRRSYRRY